MFIKSQNRKVLIDTDKIVGICIDGNSIRAYGYGYGDENLLGTYDSQSRAKEILNEIANYFQNSIGIDQVGNIKIRYECSLYEMPKE